MPVILAADPVVAGWTTRRSATRVRRGDAGRATARRLDELDPTAVRADDPRRADLVRAVG